MQAALEVQPVNPAPLPQRLLDWVTLFERLSEADRGTLVTHFTALEMDDRRRRFGVPVDDAFIERYIAGLDFKRDVIFGARSAPGQWIGIGHLVLAEGLSELGLSVLSDARGRGLGAAIFRYAVVRAARAGHGRLCMHCLTSNRAIMSIARSAGMQIRAGAGEADAYLVVPPYPEFARMLMGSTSA